jgi:hypothetical protein
MPHAAAAAVTIAVAAIPLVIPPGGGAQSAGGPPQLTRTPVVSYTVARDRRGRYVTLGAVVRLDRAMTSARRRKYSLVASPTLRTGQSVPAALFGGASLGRIGLTSRRCYSAEVSQLKRRSSVRSGAKWRLGFSDGKRVTGQVKQVTLRRSSSEWIRQAAERLGCY